MRRVGLVDPAGVVGGGDHGRRRRELIERDQLLEAGRGVDDQRDVERDPGERLGRVAEEAVVAGAEALDRDRAGHAEDQGVVAQVEGVHPLEPGVPRRFGQLRPDGSSHLCPQVIGSRCPHGGGSPGLSTGVSTGVQKHWPGVESGHDPSAEGGGSAEHRITRRTGVADHISAVDNATSDASERRQRSAPRRRGRHGGGLSMGVVRAVDSAAVRAPVRHLRRRAAPGPHLVAARAFEEAMREEDVPTEQSQAEQEARFPSADAHEGRSQRSAQPPVQGPLPPLGLIWPIRERSTFRALARGRRRRRGVVMVTCAVVGPGSEPPRVAYAIGRSVGRRRRAQPRPPPAAGRDARPTPPSSMPGHAYLVGAGPAAAPAGPTPSCPTSLHDALPRAP